MEKMHVAIAVLLLHNMLAGASHKVGQVADEGDTTVEWPRQNPEIRSLHVKTDIYFRFATTYVMTHVINTADVSKETVFTVRIPKSAFMTNFSMQSEEKIQYGEIKEMHEAKQEYARYKSKTHGGHGSKKNHHKLRGFNTFRVAVNVAAKKDMRFNLTYQELLQRRLGAYHHVIDLNPGQVVRDLKVDVHVFEARPIRTIKIPPLLTSSRLPDGNADNELAHVQRTSESAAHISYNPSVRHQLQTSPQGISGQFVMEYDVTRDQRRGELYVSPDYFVHYFAPNIARPMPKNILFLLDVSRSMSGVKMEQTKVAMTAVLEELREGDMFNIITFSTALRFWQKEGLHGPTVENLQSAREFIKQMTASRGTNVNDALLRGIEILKDAEVKKARSVGERASLIMLLMDGEPTAGIVASDRILTNVKQANNGTSSLYCLGMDKGVDFSFLQKLALQNNGKARLVYEDSDTALEFHEFYREIEKPYLSAVTFTYPGDKLVPTSTSLTHLPHYFQGSESIVAGMLNDGVSDLTANVEAMSASGRYRQTERKRVSSSPSSTSGDNSAFPPQLMERLWALLTIKRLLEKVKMADNMTISATATTRALDLSLRFSFVTPLTSMVIVKPDQPHTNVGRLKEESKNRGRNGAGSAARRHRNPTFVDNDPHFIVIVKGIDEGICFDVDGEPGDIFQLIYDKVTGIVVNGLVVGKEEDRDNTSANESLFHPSHRRTYFGEIAILYHGGVIMITPQIIKINKIKIRWRTSQLLMVGGAKVKVSAKKNITVQLKNGIVFGVLRHKVHKPHPSKVDYLGFYVEDGSKLSKQTHGLIGQFQHQTSQILEAPHIKKNGQTSASLLLQGPYIKPHDVKVKLTRRRNMELNTHVPCWHVGNNGYKLLEGTYLNYKVPSLAYRLFSMYMNSPDLLALL